MQKLVYLSNSRDFTNQVNVNENKYFKQVNELLDEGWKVSQVFEKKLLEKNIAKEDKHQKPDRTETFAAFVLLEKNNQQNQ